MTTTSTLYAQLITAPTTAIHPTNATDTRKALRNRRGDAGGAIREVTLDWDSMPPTVRNDEVDIHAPADGRPLVIRHHGFARMNIRSGHVIILAQSSAGNVIDVASGARATILGAADRKVSVRAEPGASLHLHADEGSRSRASVWVSREDRDVVDITLSGSARQV